MAKNSTVYKCTSCGNEIMRWAGKCPKCKEFGTLEETVSQDNNAPVSAGVKSAAAVKVNKNVRRISELNHNPIKRTPTGIGELDRVLGGGFVDAEVILLAGEPGSGKALAGNTPILTTKGYKRIEDISLDDIIFDGNGKKTRILQKFNPKIKRAFEITFSNGEKVKACEDHLWEVQDTKETSEYENKHIRKVTSTKEIFEQGIILPSKRMQWMIDSGIVDTLNMELPGKLNKTNSLITNNIVYITNIEEVIVDEEYYCLMVESPLHTFMCSYSNIKTHNSTISLRISEKMASLGKNVLYCSGEESEQQIGLRAKRMEITNDKIGILHETDIEQLLGHIRELKPDFMIVDSLQTLANANISGSVGSVQQSKEASHALTRIAKSENITMILINQVLKSGEFSGSESVQHIVDATLFLESDEDTPLKFLRARKNRFGDTTEVGVFQHAENGLEEVSDPSGIFLESGENVSGASCSFISEGIRQIPVEIQALVTHSILPTPRKQFNGVNYSRAQIVCAILDKFCKAKLYENDVFVSTVSGVKVIDPQADLSIAASILSSVQDKKISPETVFIGELSLTGQVRGTFMLENKLKEAERLGFTKAIVPSSKKFKIRKNNYSIDIIEISNVSDLMKHI